MTLFFSRNETQKSSQELTQKPEEKTGPRGTRTTTENIEKYADSERNNAKSNALLPIPSDLVEIMARWAGLPEAIQVAILAMVKSIPEKT